MEAEASLREVSVFFMFFITFTLTAALSKHVFEKFCSRINVANKETLFKMPIKINFCLGLLLTIFCFSCTSNRSSEASDVVRIVHKVNRYWQANHPELGCSFWDNSVYHMGNMEVYLLTREDCDIKYSLDWAKFNQWSEPQTENKSKWKFSYVMDNDYVLFGDLQACFQVYTDLFRIKLKPYMIARIMEVVKESMSSSPQHYWWRVDAIFMVLPLMAKMYQITDNPVYLDKANAYFSYVDHLLYDVPSGLYYKDFQSLYPKHKSIKGYKDFWTRGNGWAIAGLVRTLKELPQTTPYRQIYLNRYCSMVKAIAECQQPGGYWTRSMLDSAHALGSESSGTALFTYALLWGVNNHILDRSVYLPIIERAWNYLSTVALQPDGKIGYVEPIGDNVFSGQVVDSNSSSNLGVGAFLLAACERIRFLQAE